MADELHSAFGINACILPGTDGVFDVFADGQCVFSRFKEKRFPESGEITGILKRRA